MNKLLIFSAGQGGKELLFVIIEDINRINNCWNVLGFVDDKLFDSINENIISNNKVTSDFLNNYQMLLIPLYHYL